MTSEPGSRDIRRAMRAQETPTVRVRALKPTGRDPDQPPPDDEYRVPAHDPEEWR